MAVHAQFAGGLAGCGLPAFCYDNNSVTAEEQVWALGAIMAAPPATGKDAYRHPYAGGVASAAQSDLTCHGGGRSGKKRGRDLEVEHLASFSSAALLPTPATHQQEAFLAQPSSAAAANRMAGSGVASTSGRAELDSSVVSELRRHGAEVDALVRAECARMRAALEHEWKRQRLSLARAVSGVAERMLREKDAELDAARRRNAELEERLRQEAAESQAWLGAARANEAVAAGLRATLDHLLVRASAGELVVEGFGDSDPACRLPGAEADDAQSCCFVEAKDAAPAAAAKWACRACGEREASVLLLPCRHLCLCKACEPWLDACPVCLAAKNASIHVVAPN